MVSFNQNQNYALCKFRKDAGVSRIYVKFGIHHTKYTAMYSFTSDDQTILINIESNQFEIIICTKSVCFVCTKAFFFSTQLMDTDGDDDGDDDEHTEQCGGILSIHFRLLKHSAQRIIIHGINT